VSGFSEYDPPLPGPAGDSGPAFPTSHSAGMTLRDYFAAKAMASVSLPAYVGASAAREQAFQIWAATCYRAADAMLKERDK
jgi:hypothetical protein